MRPSDKVLLDTLRKRKEELKRQERSPLINVPRKVIEGFVHGFTTIKVGDDPVNTLEAIGQSLGHLAGFIGMVPGPGVANKLGLTWMAKELGVTRTVAGKAMRGVIEKAPAMIHVPSIPMQVANHAMGFLEKTVENNAALSALRVFQGTALGDVAKAGLHFGVANFVAAAQPWQAHVDQRMKGFVAGLEFGAVQRVLGTVFQREGALDLGKLTNTAGKDADTMNAVARALSTGIYSGLPSTMAGEPVEMQIYAYLLGAYFGAKELPWEMREAHRLIRNLYNKKGSLGVYEMFTMETSIPNFRNLDPKVVRVLNDQALKSAAKYATISDEWIESYAYQAYNAAKKNVAERIKKGEITPSEGRTILNAEEGKTKATIVEMQNLRLDDTKLEAVMTGNLTDENIAKYNEELMATAQSMANFRATYKDPYAAIDDVKRVFDFKEYESSLKNMTSRLESNTYFDAIDDVSVRVRTGLQDVAQSFVDKMPKKLGIKPLNIFEGVRKSLAISREFKDYAEFEKTLREGFMEVAKEKGMEAETQKAFFDSIGKARQEMVLLYNFFTQSVLVPRVHFNPLNGVFSEGKMLNGPEAETAFRMSNDFIIRKLNEQIAKIGATIKTPDGKQAEAPFAVVTHSSEKFLLVPSTQERRRGGRTITVASQTIMPDTRRNRWDYPNARSAELYELSPKIFNGILYEAALQDTPILIGVKDKNKLYSLKGWLVKGGNDKENGVNSYIQRYVAWDMAKNEGEAKNYEAILEEWNENTPVRYKDQVEANNTHHLKLFNKVLANNLKFIEIINSGIPFETILENKSGGFINTAAELVNRAQLLTSDGYEPVRSFVNDHVKVTEENGKPREGYTSLLVNAVNKQNIQRAVPDIIEWVRRDRNITAKQAKTLLDGGVFVPPELLKSIAMGSGVDPQTGAMKAVLIDSTPELGLFLSKQDLHASPPQLAAWQRKTGIQILGFDTTAKQRGNRKIYDHSWEKGELQTYDPETGEKVDKPETFILAPEGLRINISSSENPSEAIRPVRRRVQYFKNLSTPEAIDEVVRTAKLEFVDDKDYANQIRAFREGKLKEADFLFQVDNLSINQIMASFSAISALPRKVSTAIIQRLVDPEIQRYVSNERLERAGTEMDMAEVEALGQLDNVAVRFIRQTIARDLPMTALFDEPATRQYMNQALSKYIQMRLVAPKVRGSGKMTIKPIAWEYWGQVKNGYYMAGLAARNMEMQHPAKKTWSTFGKLWDEYQGLLSKKTLKPQEIAIWEDAFEHLIERVPTSDESGVRVLKFAGFTKDRGAGIYLTPKDMKYSGGADTDGDTADLYLVNSKAQKDNFRAKQNTFSTILRNGREIVFDVNDLPVFSDPHSAALKSHYKDSMSLVNPFAILAYNKVAYEGKKNLGMLLAYANRVEILKRRAQVDGRNYISVPVPEPMTKQHGFVTAEIHFRTGDEISREMQGNYSDHFTAMKSAGINKSADSAKGIPLKSIAEVRQEFVNQIFSRVVYRDANGKIVGAAKINNFYQTEIIDTPQAFLRNFPEYNPQELGRLKGQVDVGVKTFASDKAVQTLVTNAVRPLQRADQYITRRDYEHNRKFSLREWADGIREVVTTPEWLAYTQKDGRPLSAWYGIVELAKNIETGYVGDTFRYIDLPALSKRFARMQEFFQTSPAEAQAHPTIEGKIIRPFTEATAIWKPLFGVHQVALRQNFEKLRKTIYEKAKNGDYENFFLSKTPEIARIQIDEVVERIFDEKIAEAASGAVLLKDGRALLEVTKRDFSVYGKEAFNMVENWVETTFKEITLQKERMNKALRTLRETSKQDPDKLPTEEKAELVLSREEAQKMLDEAEFSLKTIYKSVETVKLQEASYDPETKTKVFTGREFDPTPAMKDVMRKLVESMTISHISPQTPNFEVQITPFLQRRQKLYNEQFSAERALRAAKELGDKNKIGIQKNLLENISNQLSAVHNQISSMREAYYRNIHGRYGWNLDYISDTTIGDWLEASSELRGAVLGKKIIERMKEGKLSRGSEIDVFQKHFASRSSLSWEGMETAPGFMELVNTDAIISRTAQEAFDSIVKIADPIVSPEAKTEQAKKIRAAEKTRTHNKLLTHIEYAFRGGRISFTQKEARSIEREAEQIVKTQTAHEWTKDDYEREIRNFAGTLKDAREVEKAYKQATTLLAGGLKRTMYTKAEVDYLQKIQKEWNKRKDTLEKEVKLGTITREDLLADLSALKDDYKAKFIEMVKNRKEGVHVIAELKKQTEKTVKKAEKDIGISTEEERIPLPDEPPPPDEFSGDHIIVPIGENKFFEKLLNDASTSAEKVVEGELKAQEASGKPTPEETAEKTFQTPPEAPKERERGFSQPDSRTAAEVYAQFQKSLGDLPLETRSRLEKSYLDLKDALEKNPDLIRHLDNIFVGVTAKKSPFEIGIDPRISLPRDIENFVDFLKMARMGGFPLEKFDWWRDLRSVGADLATAGGEFVRNRFQGLINYERDLPVIRPMKQGLNIKTEPVAYFFSHLEAQTLMAKNALSQASAWENEFHRLKTDHMRFIGQFGEDGVELYKIAMFEREHGYGAKFPKTSSFVDVYQKNAEMAKELMATKYKDKTYQVSTMYDERGRLTNNFSTRLVSAREVVDIAKRRMSIFQTELNKLIDGDPEDIAEIVKRSEKITHKTDATRGFIDTQATMANIAKHLAAGKRLNIGIRNLEELFHTVRMEEATVLVGEPGEKVMMTANSFNEPERKAEVLRHLQMKDATGWTVFQAIESPHRDMYVPHVGHSQKGMNDYLRRKAIAASRKGPKRAGFEEVFEKETLQQAEAYDKGIAIDDIKLVEGLTRKTEADYQRDLLSSRGLSRIIRDFSKDLPHDWVTTPDAYLLEGRKLASGYHNKLLVAAHRVVIQDFVKQGAFGNDTANWARFMQAYTRQAIGYPTVYPEDWVNNPQMKLKDNPIRFLQDWYYIEKAKQLGKTHFAGKDLFTVNPMEDDPKLIRDIQAALKTKDYEALKKLVDERKVMVQENISEMAANLSQLEGTYNLFTLLSHTKTLVNNLYGNVNTLIDAGFKPFWKAGNLDYLKANFRVPVQKKVGNNIVMEYREIKGWDDVYHMVEFQQGIESFIRTELNLSGKLSPEQIKIVMTEFARRRAENEGDVRTSLKEALKTSGLGEAAANLAAMPIALSEKWMRAKAFLAHAIKAREVLGFSNEVHPFDHPWVMHMAKKGVETTQFLYNNASRPAFAATSMGKVYARFQMWAWNNMRFNMQVTRDAIEAGIDPRTSEYDRYKRLVTANMFSLGLASLFPASMFEATLAAPWNYFKDLAEFFFGDTEEREKAFFGALPHPISIIQPLSPPIMRIPYSFFGSLFSGEWTDFSRYFLWTFFPFGRVARDVGSVLETPEMIVERMIGFPLHAVGRSIRDEDQRSAPKKLAGGIILPILQ